jgi:two-component system phosphate regulon response regulator PhoB
MSKPQVKILIIEDEPNQADLIQFNLEQDGYEVYKAKDGEEGLTTAHEILPDLILLDWMIPKMSGPDVCRKIRKSQDIKETPIIMISAKSEEQDKVFGLDLGVDDYISKPYSIKELLARVRAAIRRPIAVTANDKLQVGSIVMNLNSYKVMINDIDIHLGPTEYKLLLELMKNAGRVISRDQLLDRVWGITADIESRTVDVHIGRLRKALSVASDQNLIRTVRSFGYSLNKTN